MLGFVEHGQPFSLFFFRKRNRHCFDETVRQGKELEDNPHVRVENESDLTSFLEVNNITSRAKAFWLPLATSVSFRFNKIAIFEEGGHLLQHRDTVHSPDHKGTLLIQRTKVAILCCTCQMVTVFGKQKMVLTSGLLS